jgi:hypothetical protein
MGSIGIVDGLAEDLMIEADDCVGGENDVICRGGEGLRLFGGETADKIGGRFAGQAEFGDICGLDEMVDAGGKEKFVAARGGRGKDEHFLFRVARRKEVAIH